MTGDPATVDQWLSALRRSHRRLVAIVEPLLPAGVEGPSYDTEWSVAQVLSHLGSGAEIFMLFLRAGLDAEPAPGMDAFQPVWDRWNAKSPVDQATDALTSDREFLQSVGSLDEVERQSWSLSMFGADRSLAELVALRLGEHVVHTWDIEVMGDRNAVLATDAAALMVDRLDQTASRAGRPPDAPLRVDVTTDDPDRRVLLVADQEGVRLLAPEDGTAGADRTLRLPGEAFIRLVYGRLDPDRTPPVETHGVDLDQLRRLFPGV